MRDERPQATPTRSFTPAQRVVRAGGAMIAMLMWLLVIAWIIGRICTDRFDFSQWPWWMPSVFMPGVAVIGVLAALRPVRSRARRVRARRLIVWSALLIATLLWVVFIDHRLLRSAPAVPSEAQALSIAHWNMSHPGPKDWNAYAEAAAAIDADVVILSSFNHRNVLSRITLPDEQVHRFGGMFAVFTKLNVIGDRPLVNRDDDGFWSYMIELDASESLGRSLIVYLVDLPAVDWQHPLSVFARSRMDVATRFRELLDRAGAPPPDIVVGDFNMTRGSASITHVFPQLHHAWRDGGYGYSATFRRDWPLIHIDHILLADPLVAARYDLIDPGLSRHFVQKAVIVNR